jgi:hypothetical protein
MHKVPHNAGIQSLITYLITRHQARTNHEQIYFGIYYMYIWRLSIIIIILFLEEVDKIY